FEAKGISKFIAYEVSIEEAKNRYGGHFDIVIRDLRETDDLRILDYDGSRAFKMFSFKELGEPFMHEA
ncbi:cytosolic protein, partial [Spirochaetota bacterium]